MAFGEYPRNISPMSTRLTNPKRMSVVPPPATSRPICLKIGGLLLTGGCIAGDPQIFIETRSIPKIARGIRCGQSAIGPIQSRLWEQTTQWSEIS